MFGVLFILLIFVFKFKKACKIILPPFLGTCFAIAVLSLFNQPLNMFNILAMFLIMGFSIDYSIFRASGDKNSKDAVLISFISSAMSFFLLSFTSFKLISSLGLVSRFSLWARPWRRFPSLVNRRYRRTAATASNMKTAAGC